MLVGLPIAVEASAAEALARPILADHAAAVNLLYVADPGELAACLVGDRPFSDPEVELVVRCRLANRWGRLLGDSAGRRDGHRGDNKGASHLGRLPHPASGTREPVSNADWNQR